MKKILAICLAAVMVLSLIACGGETSKKEENNEPAKEETAGLDKSCVGRFADSTTFDPDTEEDAMAGGELSDKGSLDDLDIDWSTVKAAIIVKTLSNESWTNIAGGIKDALEARGVKTVDLAAPDSESDAEQQQALCDALVNKGYDIIFMSPQGDTTLDAQCREAHDAGTLVVNAFDATMQGADLYVGNNNLDIGRSAAEYICGEWCGEEGQVAVIEGLPGAYASINRTAGFLEKCEDYDGIEVVADAVGNWDRQEAMDQAATIIICQQTHITDDKYKHKHHLHGSLEDQCRWPQQNGNQQYCAAQNPEAYVAVITSQKKKAHKGTHGIKVRLQRYSAGTIL